MKKLSLFFAVLLTLPVVTLADDAAPPGDAIVGTWTTSGGASRVEVVRELSEDKDSVLYQGTIIWMRSPNFSEDDPEAGQPVRDRENPDRAKRDQPVLGLCILKDFAYVGENKWAGGTVYDPENGKTYRSQITLVIPGSTGNGEAKPAELHVRGYVGIPAFGRTTVWKHYVSGE